MSTAYLVFLIGIVIGLLAGVVGPMMEVPYSIIVWFGVGVIIVASVAGVFGWGADA